MRAMLVREPGGPDALELAEIDGPKPATDEVLVQVVAAGINPVDAGNRSDPAWASIAAPYIVGYEFSGVVLENSNGFRAGEDVWAALPVRGTRWGAYADRVAVPARLLARRPAGLDERSAGCLPLAGLTAMQVLDRLGLAPESWVLIHGAAGGVGQLLVQLAVGRGLNVAAASRPEQRVLLEELGVSRWTDRDDPDVAGSLRQSVGRPFDGAVDLVGGLLQPSLPHVREGGVGASIVDLIGDFEDAIDSNIALHGVLVQPSAAALDRLAAELGTSIRPRIQRAYPLEAAAQAHRDLAGGRVGGKLLLDIAISR